MRLGLVLCYIAPNDPQWKIEKTVKGRKSRVDVDVPLRTGALWLGDLKYRSWVPFLDDDGKPTKKPAEATTLKNILKSEWLEQNDPAIELLSTWFGFDELELRLLGAAPDKDQRQRLRDGLAKLVEFGGGDPEVYESLIEDIDARRRATPTVACARSKSGISRAQVAKKRKPRCPHNGQWFGSPRDCPGVRLGLLRAGRSDS